ncbi:MAG: RdgB/HAM1 family non-canonical purine NTP pyrophosphatase [Bacteroidales bacterium]|nr:RdgB/HAM1 family non-canonical purine NTP pyrophosphatase [Bacteroidales bacterium]
MKIVFATGNSGKLREASEILGGGFELVTPAEMGINEEIPETGSTLKANSRQKAEYLWDRCGCICFADDTGLEVDALGGAPGVHTARYAGEDKDFNKNMDKLLHELSVIETEVRMASKLGLSMKKVSRRARFRSVVTLIIDGEKHYFDGTLEGEIARHKSGNGGFGYDPVFLPDEFPGQTLADITEEQKNGISHRGKALRAMAEYLKGRDM